MDEQKFYYVPGGGATGFLGNGLIVTVSRGYGVIISRYNEYLYKERQKIHVKQYEVTKEVFNEKLQEKLDEFKELKGGLHA